MFESYVGVLILVIDVEDIKDPPVLPILEDNHVPEVGVDGRAKVIHRRWLHCIPYC